MARVLVAPATRAWPRWSVCTCAEGRDKAVTETLCVGNQCMGLQHQHVRYRRPCTAAHAAHAYMPAPDSSLPRGGWCLFPLRCIWERARARTGSARGGAQQGQGGVGRVCALRVYRSVLLSHAAPGKPIAPACRSAASAGMLAPP
jgi:hypothetical protein